MLKEKYKLICYNKFRIPNNFLLLPCMLGLGFYVYTGKKFDRFIFSSIFLSFFFLNNFIMTKRIGPIHVKKVMGRARKKK